MTHHGPDLLSALVFTFIIFAVVVGLLRIIRLAFDLVTWAIGEFGALLLILIVFIALVFGG